ncbi:MAG: hypothetical protein K8I00_02715, partial [Candidatus Omnitrophica bacterium]|nr:hypothetical protein [Candidatus Omnitrophota bacterium]
MKYISIAMLVAAFLLLRPYQMQKLGLCYKGDDFSYFAHATSIAYGQYPSYEKEYYIHGEGRPLHSIGSGIMAAPFVFVFSLIDRIQGQDIVERRTADNIRQSWSMFGFVIASCTYFWLGCWLLYLSGIRYYPQRYVVAAVILLVIIQGIPLYAFRRPIFAHVYEFFLQSVMVFYLFRPSDNRPAGLGFWLGVGVTLALMPLVRYNNAVAMGVWWGVLFAQHNVWRNAARNKTVLIALTSFIVCMGIFFLLPVLMYADTGYLTKFRYFFTPWWLAEYPQRIGNVLFGLSWGLIYSAPFILIGSWATLVGKQPEKKYLRWSMAAMLVNFHIIVTYAAQGGYYGYRYFIFSIIPLLVVPLVGWLKDMEGRYGKKFLAAVGLIALFPLFSMLCFEGNDSTLTQHIVQLANGYGYSNHTYQWEVWKLLFTQPVAWGIAVLKGGLLY